MQADVHQRKEDLPINQERDTTDNGIARELSGNRPLSKKPVGQPTVSFPVSDFKRGRQTHCG